MVATRIAAHTLGFLPRKRLSWALGRAASLRVPGKALDRAIELYVKAYDVDVSECVIPEGGYRCFNDFFTRALRSGSRPIAPDRRALVSPADGLLADAGPIAADSTFLIKGKQYEVGELLGEPADAHRFHGGRFAVVYLSPRDYHRVHAAADGTVRAVRHVPGTLYPVNAIGVRHVPRLFAKNERVAVFQDSPVHGEVATILVGAIGVGSVSLSFDRAVRTNAGVEMGSVRYPAGRQPVLERGQELGQFQLGSTVIVLTTRDADVDLSLGADTIVRVGQQLAYRRSAVPFASARTP